MTTTIGEDIAAVARLLEVHTTEADEPNDNAALFVGQAVALMESTRYQRQGPLKLANYLDDEGTEIWVRLDMIDDRDTLRRVVTTALARAAVLLDDAHREAAEALAVLALLGEEVTAP